MRWVVIILLTAVLAAIVLTIGGLLANRLPLREPPGLWPRIQTYLTTNSAETLPRHRFPELTLRCYSLPPEELLERVKLAVRMLQWETVSVNDRRYMLRAVVTTPLLRFQDDVDIKLVPADGCTELHVRSQSRIGQGDLGANTRHILDLTAALERQLAD